MSQHLFLYGTLQPALAPGEITRAVATLKPISEGSVHGVLYDLGDFPGALLDTSDSRRIFGTVFELPEDSRVLRQLDLYEDFRPNAIADSLFVRVEHTVELSDGRSLPCWIYVYNLDPAGARIIADGRYAKRPPAAS